MNDFGTKRLQFPVQCLPGHPIFDITPRVPQEAVRLTVFLSTVRQICDGEGLHRITSLAQCRHHPAHDYFRATARWRIHGIIVDVQDFVHASVRLPFLTTSSQHRPPPDHLPRNEQNYRGNVHNSPVKGWPASACNTICGIDAGNTQASPGMTNSPFSKRPYPSVTIKACSEPFPPSAWDENPRISSITKYGPATSSTRVSFSFFLVPSPLRRTCHSPAGEFQWMLCIASGTCKGRGCPSGFLRPQSNNRKVTSLVC